MQLEGPPGRCAFSVPELPEVETIVRGLDRAIRGKQIANVQVLRPEIVQSPGKSPFGRVVRGASVQAVTRRGKFAVIALDSGKSLVVHLRMTGRLIVQASSDEPLYPYTNVAIGFTDGSRLCFADVRRFGRMRLVGSEEPWAVEVGVEPLSGDFTAEQFFEMLRGRTTPIKVFLLDQRRIAGIGNIYACEALWQARIHPGKPAGMVSKPAIARLHAALQDVLQRAIDAHGSSIDDYVDAEGMKGGFQNVLAVYGRSGGECRRCGSGIIRTVIAQRGTCWCRACQKK